MFGGIGGGELLIIFVFALIFIGPKKLPELAKGLGKALREFQKAKNDLMDNIAQDSTPESPSASKTSSEEKKSDALDSKSNDNKPT